MLEHLVIYPRGGLCNRLRAIGSAKRLSSRTGARCTVVWDWGDYSAFFDDDTEWLPCGSPMDWELDHMFSAYHHIRHLHPHEGGNSDNRRVPVTNYPHVAVVSCYVFSAAEEPPLRQSPYEAPVFAWFPAPHPSILKKVRDFQEARFAPRTAGMHMRRTDNKRATSRSPDDAYFREGDRLADLGYRIFLATDNLQTLRTMENRYGNKLFHYPKSSTMPQRWPRKTSKPADLFDDMVDLWLLASCEFVIGSKFSSYSRVAILLNGSPRCKAIDRPLGTARNIVLEIGRRLARRFSSPRTSAVTANIPFGLRPGALDNARFLVKNADPGVQSALERLLVQAESAVGADLVSVVDKPKAAPSGELRDYLSFPPYYWPDPGKANGLPYIRRDCQVNPESMSDYSDKPRLLKMNRVCETLAVAYTLTGNETYAERAALQLRTWFIDPKTRMNPNLDYAQVIPGQTDGRSFGVLDGHYLLTALDAASLLVGSRHWYDSHHEALLAWIKNFLQWLRTSKNGKKESVQANNHGTLFDVQIVHLALLIGDPKQARKTAASAKKRRISAQIEANGSQPQELLRPESLEYSQYNLAALFKLATRAEHVDVDLWRYQTNAGAGIRKALDFLLPYLENSNKPWPYQGSRRLRNFDSLLLQAGRVYGNPRYTELARRNNSMTSFDLLDFVR